jgi:hypothetical protein
LYQTIHSPESSQPFAACVCLFLGTSSGLGQSAASEPPARLDSLLFSFHNLMDLDLDQVALIQFLQFP